MTLAVPTDHPCVVCEVSPGEPCQRTNPHDPLSGFHGIRGLWPQPIVAALAAQRRPLVLRVPRVGSPYWAHAAVEPSPSRKGRPRA